MYSTQRSVSRPLWRRLTAASAVIVLSACEAAPLAGEPVGGPGDIARGRAIAEANCAVCHAIGPAGASPFDGAPEFRAIAAQGDVEDLAEALAEGIGVPHKGKEVMPEFVLEPRQIEDLIAYLNSLKHL